MRSSVVFSVFIAAALARTAYICNVQLPGYPDSSPEPTISFGGQSYRFIDTYNAISFGSFYAPSADVEGRAAVRNNVDVSSYSFGYELITAGANMFSQHTPYSLVAGGNVNFNGGALYPQGNNIPYAGQKEYMYIGGAFTGSSYLASDSLFAQNSGNKNAEFDNALAYYTGLSAAFAAVPANAAISVQWGTATFTCNSATATTYFVNTDVTTLTSINFWANSPSCASGAKLVINVAGSGVAQFAGNNINQFDAHNIVYNFISASQVTVMTRVEGSILAPVSTYFQPGAGVVEGIVIAATMSRVHQINILRHCVPPVEEPAPVFPCPAWEGECDGFDLTLNGATYSFKDFNAISFGDFVAESGDVEGRLAVRNNAQLATYSVGYELQTTTNDRSLPFALVVGGDLTFTSGAIYPQGNAIPYVGTQENIAVGGNFAGADYLAAQVSSIAGVQAQFDAAQACYTTISDNIASNGDNVQKEIQDSGAFLTCSDSTNTIYIVSFTPEELTQFTYYLTINCNSGASWYINIRGSGDVTFTGDSFPAIPGGVVYNVLGSRTINVNAVALNGHLLAPTATLNQVGGVILGKVVVGDVVMSLQINRENTCIETVTYNVPAVLRIIAADRDVSESGDFCATFVNDLQVGDVIFNGPTEDASEVGRVVSVDQGVTCVSQSGKRSEKRLNNASYSVYGYIRVLSTAPNTQAAAAAEPMDSSASAIGFSVVAMTIAALAL